MREKKWGSSKNACNGVFWRSFSNPSKNPYYFFSRNKTQNKGEKIMDTEEIDIRTLSADELRLKTTERLMLEPKQSIRAKVKSIKAQKTEYGLLFTLILDYNNGDYSLTSWNFVSPTVSNVLELKDKNVKITNTGSKKYRLEPN